MKYGYVKSNLQEGIEKQIKELSNFNLDKIVKETDGSKLIELLQELKPGDSLHIVSPDRLTRKMEKYVLILSFLQSKQVELVEINKSNIKNPFEAILDPIIDKAITDILTTTRTYDNLIGLKNEENRDDEEE